MQPRQLQNAWHGGRHSCGRGLGKEAGLRSAPRWPVALGAVALTTQPGDGSRPLRHMALGEASRGLSEQLSEGELSAPTASQAQDS